MGLEDTTLRAVSGLLHGLLMDAADGLLVPAPVPHSLAACAPELLQELRYLRDCLESGQEPAMGRVNRAINRAEGGDQ